jgi:hypothetical protein
LILFENFPACIGGGFSCHLKKLYYSISVSQKWYKKTEQHKKETKVIFFIFLGGKSNDSGLERQEGHTHCQNRKAK